MNQIAGCPIDDDGEWTPCSVAALQVRFAGIDCSGAALEMAKSALLSSCEGLAPCNISLVCEEYTQGARERGPL